MRESRIAFQYSKQVFHDHFLLLSCYVISAFLDLFFRYNNNLLGLRVRIADQTFWLHLLETFLKSGRHSGIHDILLLPGLSIALLKVLHGEIGTHTSVYELLLLLLFLASFLKLLKLAFFIKLALASLAICIR